MALRQFAFLFSAISLEEVESHQVGNLEIQPLTVPVVTNQSTVLFLNHMQLIDKIMKTNRLTFLFI